MDGFWRVERISGLLPPWGVTKRIDSMAGWTYLFGLPVGRFQIRIGPDQKLFLVYRYWPITDELTGQSGQWRGRGLLGGFCFCQFRLVRQSQRASPALTHSKS